MFGRTINWHEPYFTYAGYAAGERFCYRGAVRVDRVLSRKVLQRTAALGESEQRFRQIAENIREVSSGCSILIPARPLRKPRI